VVGLQNLSLSELVQMMVDLGADQVFAKILAPNDNSKNQPYLAKGDLSVLNVFPVGSFVESRDGKTPTFKTPFPLYWVTPDGQLERAPGSQLIVYPKYPEVRLSGFLRGTNSGPNALMSSRQPGRVMMLASTPDGRVLGIVLHPGSAAATELSARSEEFEKQGVLFAIPVAGWSTSRKRLLDLLGRVHRKGWTDSVRLTSAGLVPCVGTNCGGCTLEALMGIASNSAPGPDFDGWEIKGHHTRGFSRPATGQVTLMTPAPTGGLYKQDPVKFVHTFGYPHKGNRDRTNFSSPHRVGVRNRHTGLTPKLEGFDVASGRIVEFGGRLVLTNDAGFEAATWDFPALMEKWTHKHAKAAFVPYMSRTEPDRQYAYGPMIKLGEGTDFLRFLRQLALGHVAYDPGIWIAGGKIGRARSQFRVAARYVPELYHSVCEAPVG